MACVMKGNVFKGWGAMVLGEEALKEIMLVIKNKVEADPTLEVSDIITLIEKYFTEDETRK